MTAETLGELFASISNSSLEAGIKERKKSKTHTHAYEKRISPTGKDTYYCTLPSCTHCLNIPHSIIGRKSLCPGCNKEFIISPERLLFCDNCEEK